MAVPPISTGALLVFGIIGVALILFVTELLPTDITAIGIIVGLVVLNPWTRISGLEAISGFSSPATITIAAMYMLSAGIQKTGIVQQLGRVIGKYTRGSEPRLLAATIGTTGPIAGIINNTPVVAVFIPMIADLADASSISPSKLLLPLSYAAMLGGTLTLIGTSTNILASDLSRQLLNHPIGMFEFTKLGIIVLIVGAAYLLTVGSWLTPARIPPNLDLTEEFDLEDYLSKTVVREGSPLVGLRAGEVIEKLHADEGLDIDLVQIDRNGEQFLAAGSDIVLEPGDELTVRGSLRAVNRFGESYQVRHLPREEVTDGELELTEGQSGPVEFVVPIDSEFVGKPVAEVKFEERYDSTILALRRGETVYQTELDAKELSAGDTILLQTTDDATEFLAETGELFPTHVSDEDLLFTDEAGPTLSRNTVITLGIMAGVIAIAALGLVPIVIAALGGVVAMVVTRSLTSAEAYEAVSWNIIFLLAGVIPLGLAMQKTGGAEFIAALLVQSADIFPAIVVLALFYLLTGLLANIITPVASVVLMIPVAVDTASRIGANGFAFLLAVTFAASTAFMTPVGYQTNLMVYGPGGYRFTDYVKVGAPLQFLLTIVTTLGIVAFWGV